MMGHRHASSARSLATGLGCFSIGLGIYELIAPRHFTRTLGLQGKEDLVRAFGVREIAKGIGILTSQRPSPWLWARVAGDALDLAALSGGLDERNPKRRNVELALAAVAGVTALDVLAAQGTAQAETRRRVPRRDYSTRSGFPKGAQAARGAAGTETVPPDFREPSAMRPPGWDQPVLH
jgi:hypothetical protein